jgi:hypothetical protein
MSSTESKNISQPFIDFCHTFGILGALQVPVLLDFPVTLDSTLFTTLQSVDNLYDHVISSDDPISTARLWFPDLDGAPIMGYHWPILDHVARRSRILLGNQAVLTAIDIFTNSNIRIQAKKCPHLEFATKNFLPIAKVGARASYINEDNYEDSLLNTTYNATELRLRNIASALTRISQVSRARGNLRRTTGFIGRYKSTSRIPAASSNPKKQVTNWNKYLTDHPYKLRDGYPISPYHASSSTRSSQACHSYPNSPLTQQEAAAQAILQSVIDGYGKPKPASQSDNSQGSSNSSVPPIWRNSNGANHCTLNPTHTCEVGQSFLTVNRTSSLKCYAAREYLFIEFSNDLVPGSDNSKGRTTLALNQRDISDIDFLLNADANTRLYIRRCTRRGIDDATESEFSSAASKLCDLRSRVISKAAQNRQHRNDLGVYMDILMWQFLASLCPNELFDHAKTMKDKIAAQGLVAFPSQEPMLKILRDLPVDMAIDLLGIYKASPYPEVEGFSVISEQKSLHENRAQTDWEVGSPEHIRFHQTAAYMWYLGVTTLHVKNGYWPGKIREGALLKPWHEHYASSGLSIDDWESARDVDLTRALPASRPNAESYLRQADSSSAPAEQRFFKSQKAYRNAPREQKRKLLYTIQCLDPPNLTEVWEKMNEIGRTLPDGYVGKLSDYTTWTPPFSMDISTGARTEHQKKTCRPFYQSSSPAGCLHSHADMYARNWLSYFPQSLLGKSYREKFQDLNKALKMDSDGGTVWYLSDDKKKYSPHMDPNSQQLSSDFFAELSGEPASKVLGPLMYHNDLYYRLHGHMVHYPSNGTDREGVRGSANTWLEICIQGVTTRLCRQEGKLLGRTSFSAFVDDALRAFVITGKTAADQLINLKYVVDDIEFGLKVMGRQMSWDKAFLSTDFCMVLNELCYQGFHYSSGLKSFCQFGELDLEPVMNFTSYESTFYGKARGAHQASAPLDICWNMYIVETLATWHKMGGYLQDNSKMDQLLFAFYSYTPICLGGLGIRSLFQLESTEIGTAYTEGMGIITQMSLISPFCFDIAIRIAKQEVQVVSDLDLLRNPTQVQVAPPRIQSQRVVSAVRTKFNEIVRNPDMRNLTRRAAASQAAYLEIIRRMRHEGYIDEGEVESLYKQSALAQVDNLIQKVSASQTAVQLLDRQTINKLRLAVRADVKNTMNKFGERVDYPRLYRHHTAMFS